MISTEDLGLDSFLECAFTSIFEPTLLARDVYISENMSGLKIIPFGRRKTEFFGAATHLSLIGVKGRDRRFGVLTSPICPQALALP